MIMYEKRPKRYEAELFDGSDESVQRIDRMLSRHCFGVRTTFVERIKRLDLYMEDPDNRPLGHKGEAWAYAGDMVIVCETGKYEVLDRDDFEDWFRRVQE